MMCTRCGPSQGRRIIISRHPKKNRGFSTARGFTLVELLVVIAIIAILLALLLPFIKRAHQSAQNQVCKSNLRQIGFAIRMYCDDNRGRFPDPYTLGGAWFRRPVGERDPDDPASLPEVYGWSALLQPYLKVKRENNIWLCRSNRDDYLAHKISYAGNTWPGGPTSKPRLAFPQIDPTQQAVVFENWQLEPWKSGVPAPLDDRYPPGYEYSAKWVTNGMNASPYLSATHWQGGPHYYNLQRNTSYKTTVLNTDGYSHSLHLDLSIHVRRHYKLIIVPNGYTVVFPDPVD